MKSLLFDCSYTEVWASPKDWKTATSKKALQKEWYIQYYFYDPLFHDKYPNGKPVRKKLNFLRTLEERKAAIEFYLAEIPRLLEQDGFNPITKKFMAQVTEKVTAKLNPDMPCTEAIEMAWDKILTAAKTDDNPRPFDDVRIAKNRFVSGLKDLRFDTLKIKDLLSPHIKETIEYLKITDGYYNKFLSYMSKIYTELYEYSCVTTNPFKLYKKKKPVKKMREVLEDEAFEGIMDYLYENNYTFYRYGMIFHMSGARSTELMMVKKKDVNLEKQEYKVLIKKGGQYVEEIKVIMLDVLPYWREVLKECKSEDHYIFSKGLKPGPVPIDPAQISRRWNRHVKTNYHTKTGIKITVDFYPLKHLFLDRLDAQRYILTEGQALNVPDNLAQLHASHRSPTITNSVYLINKKKRDRDVLKTVTIK